MKSIKILKDDIYGLFSSDFNPAPEDTKMFGQRLAEHLFARLTEQRGEPTLRMSNIGTPCNRKLWYSINRPSESEPLRPETRLKFLFGDILEELLLWLAKLAGHHVEAEQEEVVIYGSSPSSEGEHAVRGHKDGYIDGNAWRSLEWSHR